MYNIFELFYIKNYHIYTYIYVCIRNSLGNRLELVYRFYNFDIIYINQ